MCLKFEHNLEIYNLWLSRKTFLKTFFDLKIPDEIVTWEAEGSGWYRGAEAVLVFIFWADGERRMAGFVHTLEWGDVELCLRGWSGKDDGAAAGKVGGKLKRGRRNDTTRPEFQNFLRRGIRGRKPCGGPAWTPRPKSVLDVTPAGLDVERVLGFACMMVMQLREALRRVVSVGNFPLPRRTIFKSDDCRLPYSCAFPAVVGELEC